jgi:hypothetical protein
MAASRVIDYLARFNRKERFLLVGWALDNNDFRLGDKFRASVKRELGIDIPKQDCFAAMDYHLDWLYASLLLGTKGGETESHANPRIVERSEGTKTPVIGATQEDIDFIIAYEDGADCHIVIIEAKGVTGCTSRQMESKADRLRAYFGMDGKKWGEKVIPHFAIVSPKSAPEGLRIKGWPTWMKPDGRVPFIEMPTLRNDLLRVTRWDDTQAVPSKDGDCWKAVSA